MPAFRASFNFQLTSYDVYYVKYYFNGEEPKAAVGDIR